MLAEQRGDAVAALLSTSMRHLFQESFFYTEWLKRLFHDQIKLLLLHVGLETVRGKTKCTTDQLVETKLIKMNF